MKQISTTFILLLFIVALLSFSALANQSIKWEFIETENLKIIYHPEVKEQAYHIAKIAEEVFNDLSQFTGFKPYRKIAIVVSGQDDIANGFAIPRDVIKIWVNPLHISTRVDKDWLKTVVTHELTHLVQMEATFETTYLIHKLTGASTPLLQPPNTFYPTWFLEGVAQYGSARFGYDSLDRKRQMILEQKIHTDNFFTDAELIWGRSNIGGEAIYNYGFGFLDYLMRTYGEEKFLELQKTHNDLYFLGLNNTIRIVYGKRLDELINEWKDSLKKRFPIRINREKAISITNKPNLAQWNEPQVTPEGGIIFAESHIDRSSIRIRYWNPEKGLITLLEDPALFLTRLSLSSDGERLLYIAWEYKNQHLRYDLYELDLKSKKTIRLTKDERILLGVHYGDGYLVVKNDWGRNRLYYLFNGQLTQLTDNDYNFNITDLAVSPDQKRVAINFNYNGRRGIGILNTDSWTYDKIFFPSEGLDWLLGDFIDNKHLTLSWDRLDHYDLYCLNIDTGICERITNTREDILQGQVRSINGQTYWYGQIYGPEGFTIAKGKIFHGEKITLEPEEISFNLDPIPQLKPVNKGNYNPLSQLRSDLFIPYVTTDQFTIGLTHLLTDPLMELIIYYNLEWDPNKNHYLIDLDSIWQGTNPGFNLTLHKDKSKVQAALTQFYDSYPYYLSIIQGLEYDEQFRLDKLGLQVDRVWQKSNPGKTTLSVNYFFPTSTEKDGFDFTLKHSQNISIGYRGHSLTSTTRFQYTRGRIRIPWGRGTEIMWVDSNYYLAEMLIHQQINYQHNLVDLSFNFSDFIQTGRLYLNLFSELGLFYNNGQYIIADMIGTGLEFETKIVHQIQLNHSLNAAINSKGDWDIKYDIKFPF
ncbi:hypothetical protein BBF96_05685 [Anoxybacter fermentans]|uniref:Peptidase MA-like domain-containing protein n=1 Tax=Anoxybacter fermentans TaxID=1323375 RepID=A0A3Q9HPS4_9FIRM|nr:hypothetical protein [Anoxybacter fermentans]AZR72926.1 hypothetical protein BBF96_05685 [Anoxybacter fermentans]